jgi:hypothetical protein
MGNELVLVHGMQVPTSCNRRAPNDSHQAFRWRGNQDLDRHVCPGCQGVPLRRRWTVEQKQHPPMSPLLNPDERVPPGIRPRRRRGWLGTSPCSGPRLLRRPGPGGSDDVGRRLQLLTGPRAGMAPHRTRRGPHPLSGRGSCHCPPLSSRAVAGVPQRPAPRWAMRRSGRRRVPHGSSGSSRQSPQVYCFFLVVSSPLAVRCSAI